MDERLLVQATPALLDGWCGPVVTTAMAESRIGYGSAVLRVDPGHRCRIVGWSDDWYPVGSVYLDLSRAECRDRVVRVLSGWDRSCTAPAFKCVGIEWYDYDLDRRWEIDCAIPSSSVASPSCTSWGGDDTFSEDMVVPALAALDPNDNTRLPDNSRLVDALALAEVWRYVASKS